MEPVPSPSPEDRRRQDGLIITSVVMTTMAGLFVIFRCISRFILIRNPGPDDYFMLAALLLTVGYVVEIFILKANHLGFPMTMLTPDNMVTFIKVTLGIQTMYYANVFCIKTSILLTYLRFAVSRTFRMLCFGTILIHAIFFVVCLCVTLAQCLPLERMWDLTGTVEGRCINTTAFFYSTSAFNIVTDIWILIIPFKTLHGIQRPRHEKVALFCIFGVGAFATVASIVRLHTIYIYTLAEDPFRDGVAINLWSIIEVTIAISCASVSALKPIFSGRQRRATRAAKTSTTSGRCAKSDRMPKRRNK
ncbi:integral membrane protein [Lasiosphaeris hirsuta]|uniref:Integral membrane protein n=1 Tax=Lasiosphaeris hirsuta TaxID=260670 RepID=A0AA40DXL8_9PEZI|nr:integral membrane protein [Lasiosphaeris hirsuta]